MAAFGAPDRGRGWPRPRWGSSLTPRSGGELRMRRTGARTSWQRRCASSRPWPVTWGRGRCLRSPVRRRRGSRMRPLPAWPSGRRSRGSILVARPEHEVVHEELAATLEQLRQRARAAIGVEAVLLLDASPGKRAPLPRQFVAQPRVLLLTLEQFLASRNPRFPRCDRVRGHRHLRGRSSLERREPFVRLCS
jgi:hypothetical protein